MKTARPFSAADEGLFEDLAQDTYLRLCVDGFKVLRHARAEHPNSIYSLVQSVAYAVTIDHFRAQLTAKRGGFVRKVSLDTLLHEVESLESPENDLEMTLLLDRLGTLLDAILPEKTRVRDKSIFWLRYRQGFTAGEISRLGQHGLSEKGVVSLLSRTIRDLQEKLGGWPE